MSLVETKANLRSWNARAALVAMALVVVFVGLALATRRAGPLPGDLALTHALQALCPCESVARSSPLRATIGMPLGFFFVVAAVGLLLSHRWAPGALVLSGLLLGLGLERVLKSVFARPRPTPDLVDIYAHVGGYSFPSGTAIQFVMLTSLVGYLAWSAYASASPGRPALLVVLALLATPPVLGGLFVVYVGAHWATDVLGGWLVGGAASLGLIGAYRRLLSGALRWRPAFRSG